jgi:hypothetical protein
MSYPSIGSLHPECSGDVAEVGPFVSLEHFIRPTAPYFLGSFQSNAARYLAHIDLLLDLI